MGAKLLIDWGLAAPNCSFEIRVRDVRQASSFYRDVLGAREIFRRATDDGVPVRVVLAAGGIQFVLSSQDEEGREPASLSRLAAELGVPYLAVIMQVDDPNTIAFSATQKGAVLKEPPDSEEVVVVADPFGSHWAFIKREPADSPLLSRGDQQPMRRSSARH